MHSSPDNKRVLRTAAWMWAGYLIALIIVDAVNYARAPKAPIIIYYMGNGLAALVFLWLSYWDDIHEMLGTVFIPLMLVLISGAPIALNHLLVPHFPPGPMSNAEGMTLRQLPVLFIGLAMTAWQYRLWAVIVFSFSTAAFELLTLGLLSRMPPNIFPVFFIITIIRTISFLVVGIFISQIMTRLREQQQSLQQANARLTRYAGTVEQLTLSRERNRLARELHDTLAHSLSALSVQLETLKAYWDVEPQTARTLLEQALAATRTGLNETRRALKALRATPLDDLGLRLALEKTAQDAARRGVFDLHLSLPGYFPPLDASVEQCIYRIAQEALENVVRHAQARQVTVALTTDGELRLEISDDGVGFDPRQAAAQGRFGLHGMKERAALAGASLDVGSQPGQGTCLCLTFPEIYHAD